MAEPPTGQPPPGAILRVTWPAFCEDVETVELTVYVNGATLFTQSRPVDPHFMDFYAADYPNSTYTADVIGKTAVTGCTVEEAP